MRFSLVSSVFLFASTTLAFANPILPASAVISPGKFYIGVFGGGGSPNHFNASQYGTAFFTEAQGGPLSVNAFGSLDNHNALFWGAQLGYEAPAILLNASSQWTLGPAAELEAYIISKHSFDGTLVNDTTRLDEHDFNASYPMRPTVFLANAVLNFDSPCLLVRPYIGLGIGSAIVRITDASSSQVNPPEAGINHYNANTSDSTSAFAGQAKIGLIYDFNDYVSVYADYRWLYLANTQFLFGSTVYPTHVETTSWQVALDSQKYNLGNVGIRINW